MKQLLKKQYDGYHFSEAMQDIYNPFSIINVFADGKLYDYWYQSGTPTYLAKLLEGHAVNMQRLTGRSYREEYFQNYKADKEEPLAMFYQSGYLTIKEYNARDNLYRLDYPNDEVRRGFEFLVSE